MLLSHIESGVVGLSENPLNPTWNYLVGKYYDDLGQTAAATGFYLRAAEYGVNSEDLHERLTVYKSLLKISSCMDRQKDRDHTAKNSLLQAISYMPEQPEAYFLLSQYYERKGIWQECYTTASIGKLLAGNPEVHHLEENFGYEPLYVFDFEKAVSGWWIGRRDESIKTFEWILSLGDRVTPEYVQACRVNLEKIK